MQVTIRLNIDVTKCLNSKNVVGTQRDRILASKNIGQIVFLWSSVCLFRQCPPRKHFPGRFFFDNDANNLNDVKSI